LHQIVEILNALLVGEYLGFLYHDVVDCAFTRPLVTNLYPAIGYCSKYVMIVPIHY
jgi:hypothetical protein